MATRTGGGKTLHHLHVALPSIYQEILPEVGGKKSFPDQVTENLTGCQVVRNLTCLIRGGPIFSLSEVGGDDNRCG
jgi:hypothetical protein